MALPTPTPQTGPGGLIQPTAGPLVDRFGRVHTYLRVSVTDRCNFRCAYCMPAEGLDWMPRAHLLSYEEITRVVGVFASMGIERVRLTGGEPSLRRGIADLVGRIAGIPGVRDVSMTTNGHALAPSARTLRNAGLTRVNVSLDSVDPDVFRAITRGADVHQVLAGIDAALEAGLTPVKVNCVVVGGVNDHGVEAMVEHFAARPGTQLRFIEFMPFGTGPSDALRPLRRPDASGVHLHVPSKVLRERPSRRWAMEPVPRQGGGPSADVRLDNGLVVGFISPITEHFCHTCNRLRLQADGSLRTCLSRDRAPNLRDLLRAGVSDDALEQAVRAQVFGKVAGHEAHLDGADRRAFEGVMTRIGG